MVIHRGDIYYADLSPVQGSEQGGIRPVLVVQNDMGNKHSPTTIVAIITSKTTKAKLPTQVWLSVTDGFKVNSMVMCEQVRTIDKTRLKSFIGRAQSGEMKLVDEALQISLGL